MAENNISLDMAEKRIKAYLDDFAKGDEVFASKYKSDNESIRKCRVFIEQQVRKTMRSMFTDEEIFGMAVHYFDEGLEMEDTKVTSNIVHSGDYSQEEIDAEIAKMSEQRKEALRKKAEDSFSKSVKAKMSHQKVHEEANKLKPKKEPKAKKVSEPMMLDLFAGLE